MLGYAFCIHKQFLNDNSMTDIKTLYIDDLCVDESSRGLHIGQQLYAYVIDYARAAGYYKCYPERLGDNKPALHFYEKIGLRVQKNRHGKDTVTRVKRKSGGFPQRSHAFLVFLRAFPAQQLHIGVHIATGKGNVGNETRSISPDWLS